MKRFKGRDAKLLERNPVAWLAGVPRWQGIIATVITATAGWFTLVAPTIQGTAGALSPWLMHLIPHGLNVLVARQATLLFAEGRRNGGLELLLCTPLERKAFIDGQLLAIRRGLLLPYLVCIGALWINLLVSFWRLRDKGGPGDETVVIIGMMFYLTVRILLGAKAAAVTGVYFGLTSRNPDTAALKSVLVVVGLPFLLFCVPGVVFYAVLLIVFSNRLNRGIDTLLERRLIAGSRPD